MQLTVDNTGPDFAKGAAKHPETFVVVNALLFTDRYDPACRFAQL